MENAQVPIRFDIYQGGELVRAERLCQDIIKVGKLPSSHLCIEDAKVSRMHAIIEVTGKDDIFIIDLGSRAGTIVNGDKVSKQKLTSGDEIQLGDTRVLLTIETEPAAHAYEAQAPAQPMAPPPAYQEPAQAPPQPAYFTPPAQQAPAAASPTIKRAVFAMKNCSGWGEPRLSETTPIGVVLPTTEYQARPLTQLPPDQQREWKLGIDKSVGMW